VEREVRTYFDLDGETQLVGRLWARAREQGKRDLVIDLKQGAPKDDQRNQEIDALPGDIH
jgi:hypothetical protein